jgi:ribose transport system permease protein
MKIPPFIATLGMMLILKGLSLVISGTKPIYFNDTPGYPQISTGSIIGTVFPTVPVPNGVLILFVLALFIGWVLTKTVLGRYCYALGSNEEAVRLSGVNTDGDLCTCRGDLRRGGAVDFQSVELCAASAWPWV